MRLPHTRAESAVGAASLRSLSGRCAALRDWMTWMLCRSVPGLPHPPTDWRATRSRADESKLSNAPPRVELVRRRRGRVCLESKRCPAVAPCSLG